MGVRELSFHDSALVLVGHGSTKNDQSSASVRAQVEALRARHIFAEVHCAFLKEEPFLSAVAATLSAPRGIFVPMFISEGYFSEVVIPEQLGFQAKGQGAVARVLNKPGSTWVYSRAVGTHESLTSVVLARAKSVVGQFPFPRAPQPEAISLFIAGHGTPQNANSRKSIDAQVSRIAAMNLYAAVQAVFIEEAPRIDEVFELAQTRNLVVVPFFIGDGMHVREDLPILLGEPERLVRERLARGQPGWRNPSEKRGKLVWLSSSVGSDPLLAEIVLARVSEVCGDPVPSG